MNDDSQKDPVEALYEYINKNESFKIDEEMAKDSTEQEYKGLNLALISLGLPGLGDLTTLPKEDLDKTNTCINALIQKIQVEISLKTQAEEAFEGFKAEYGIMAQKLRDFEQKMEEKEREIEKLKVQHKALDMKSKNEKEKLVAEREDAAKRFSQVLAQQMTYQAELKRREKEIGRLQEYLAKSKQPAISAIELSAPLNYSLIHNKNSEDGLLVTLTKGYEENVQELKNEVKAYQELYKKIQDEIEMLIRVRKIDGIKKIADSLYNFPAEIATDKVLAIFKENMEKVRRFVDEADVLKPREPENTAKLEEILEKYTELAKVQAESVKRTCTIPKSSSHKLLGDHEFENMWKIIVGNKRVLEENRKIINEEKAGNETKLEGTRLVEDTFSSDKMKKAFTQNLIRPSKLVSPSFGGTLPFNLQYTTIS